MAKGKILGFPTSYVLIALLLVGYFYVPAFSTAINDLWSSIAGSVGLSGVSTSGNYVGNVQFVITPQDTLVGTTAAPTGDTVRWYPTKPSSMDGGTDLTLAGHTLSALPSGECWLAFYGGTDFFTSPDRLLSLNPGIFKSGTGYWTDLNSDNTPEYVVAVDTSKIGVTGQAQTPVISITHSVLNEDMTLAVGTGATDQNGVGAAQVVTSATWALNGLTLNDGMYITRLYFTINSTIAAGEVIPEEMTWSGGLAASSGCQTSWSAPVKQVEGSTSYWYYITGEPIHKNYYNGQRIWYKTGESDTMYLTVNFRCTLVAGQEITLCIDAVDGGGTSQAQLTDAVVFNHG